MKMFNFQFNFFSKHNTNTTRIETSQEVSTETQARFFTVPHEALPQYIVRLQDLAHLETMLEQGQRFIWLSGQRNLTEGLLEAFYARHKGDYLHIGWLSYQKDNLLTTFLGLKDIVAPNDDIKITDQLLQQLVRNALLNNVTNQTGKKLLVIEGISDTEYFEDAELYSHTFQCLTEADTTVLLVSEDAFSFRNYAILSLDTLNRADVETLFEQLDKKGKHSDLVRLLQKVNYDAYCVSLLLKATQRNDKGDFKNLLQSITKTLDQNREILEKPTIPPQKLVAALFDALQPDTAATWLLLQFAVLPNQAYTGDWLATLLGLAHNSDVKEVDDKTPTLPTQLASYVFFVSKNGKKLPSHPNNTLSDILNRLATQHWLHASKKGYQLAPELRPLLRTLYVTHSSHLVFFNDLRDTLNVAFFYPHLGILQSNTSYLKHLTTFLAFFDKIYDDTLLDLQERLVQYYMDLMKYDKAIIPVRKYAAMLEFKQHYSRYDNRHYFIGTVFYENTLFHEALSHFKKSKDYFDNNGLSKSIDYTKILNSIGSAYNYLEDYKKSLEFHYKALKIQEQVVGLEHIDTAKSLQSIGSVYCTLGDHKKSLEYLDKALKIQEQLVGLEHIDTASCLQFIGIVYGELYDYKKSLKYLNKALKIYEQIVGLEHINTVGLLNSIATIYDNLGNFEKSLEYNYKALKICEKIVGLDHIKTANILSNLAYTYYTMSINHDLSQKYNQRSIAIYEKHGLPIRSAFLYLQAALQAKGNEKDDETNKYLIALDLVLKAHSK